MVYLLLDHEISKVITEMAVVTMPLVITAVSASAHIGGKLIPLINTCVYSLISFNDRLKYILINETVLSTCCHTRTYMVRVQYSDINYRSCTVFWGQSVQLTGLVMMPSHTSIGVPGFIRLGPLTFTFSQRACLDLTTCPWCVAHHWWHWSHKSLPRTNPDEVPWFLTTDTVCQHSQTHSPDGHTLREPHCPL